MTLPEGILSAPCQAVVKGSGLDALPRTKLVAFRSGHGGNLSSISTELRLELDRAYAEGKRLSQPQAVLSSAPPSAFPPDCAPQEFYEASLCLVFVSSLGSDIDLEIDALFASGASLRGSFLDSWGSESLEAFNESIHEGLKLQARREGLRAKKLGSTLRFSPGYGSVPVQANASWLSLFPQFPLSASAQSGILCPRKSSVCLLAWDT